MALVSEGISDDRFLLPVLQRSAAQLCPADAQVDQAFSVRAAAGPAAVADVVTALANRSGAFRLIVVHHDGGSDPDDARSRWVSSLEDRWRAAGNSEPVVGVVPVRETEAWALADPLVLRAMLGRSRSDRSLGLPPRPADLERLPDPKRTLRLLFERHRRWDPEYLQGLGAGVSLDRLRELPAFRRWENDLEAALKSLPGFTTR
jgi:Domain of unknown function (DUF4276)